MLPNSAMAPKIRRLSTSAEQIKAGPWDLIEKLGSEIAEAILAAYPSVAAIDVVVHKPQAPIPVPFSDVTISLTRHQKQHTAIIALGANLGDPQATLAAAVQELGAETEPTLTRNTKWSRTSASPNAS